jgi:hypothetical protein
LDNKKRALEWESRWALPVALLTFVAVLLLIGSGLLNQVSGDHEAEILRSVHAHSGSVTINGLLQAVGFGLLALPLIYLFRAVRARSPQVRGQLIGLVIAAPLFLAVSGALSVGARTEAANQFVNGEAKSTLSAKEANEKCGEAQEEESAAEFREEFEPGRGETPLAACEHQEREDDRAENAIGEASLAAISSGLGIAGGLGFLIALFYSNLWAMRTGLLTRFWSSLGMASGVAFLLGPLFLITLIWMVYFGLLIIGKVPGGKPPAWTAGEAVPWPTPGERAAAELEPSQASEPPEPGELPGSPDPDASPASSPKRKRKQR